MKEFKVEIPEEKLSLMKFTQKELPGIAVVNKALNGFEPKEVFAWHLSIVIDLKLLIDNGMPSIEEREVVDPFGDEIEKEICGNPEMPNALFLARVTWNATRELVFRVFDPEVANGYLQKLISSKDYIREFDFRMEHDLNWEKTKFYLESEIKKREIH